MKRYAGYLFDLDGTLIDTAPDLRRALNHVLAGAGCEPVDDALTRHWVGHGAKVLIEQALIHQNRPVEGVEALMDEFIRYYRDNLSEHSTPYPHVVQSLEALLDRGARLAVVTNKRAGLAQPLLAELDMARLFHCVVGGDTAARAKPAADPALYACQALELDPADVLFVGDSAADVGCARAAGCDVVCVPDGYNHGTPAHELGADGVIDSFKDLV